MATTFYRIINSENVGFSYEIDPETQGILEFNIEKMISSRVGKKISPNDSLEAEKLTCYNSGKVVLMNTFGDIMTLFTIIPHDTTLSLEFLSYQRGQKIGKMTHTVNEYTGESNFELPSENNEVRGEDSSNLKIKLLHLEAKAKENTALKKLAEDKPTIVGILHNVKPSLAYQAKHIIDNQLPSLGDYITRHIKSLENSKIF